MNGARKPPDATPMFCARVRVEQPKGIHAIYAAAKQMDAELTAMSWSGFNIAGDRKSIDEVHRLMHVESRVRALEERLQALQPPASAKAGAV